MTKSSLSIWHSVKISSIFVAFLENANFKANVFLVDHFPNFKLRSKIWQTLSKVTKLQIREIFYSREDFYHLEN